MTVDNKGQGFLEDGHADTQETGFTYSSAQVTRIGQLQFDRQDTGLVLSLGIDFERRGHYTGILARRYDRNPNGTTNHLGSLTWFTDGRVEKEGSFDLTEEQVQKTLDTIDVMSLYTDSNFAPTKEERQQVASRVVLIYQLVMGQCTGAREKEA